MAHLKHPPRPPRRRKWRVNQHVFCRLYADDGDNTLLHCRVVACTGTARKPTYTLAALDMYGIAGEKEVTGISEKAIYPL